MITPGVSKNSIQKDGDKNIYIHSTDSVFKIALYTSDADISPDTLHYTPDGEVEGIGYEPGGKELTGIEFISKNGIFSMSWQPVVWEHSSIKAHGALIYNASNDNRAVYVTDFNNDIESVLDKFTVAFPPINFDESNYYGGQIKIYNLQNSSPINKPGIAIVKGMGMASDTAEGQ